jgi:ElaB/YqjD/DUF883 family membrane-anchored ribosome-binding protein
MASDQDASMKSAEDRSSYECLRRDVEAMKADISKLAKQVTDTFNDLVGTVRHEAHSRYNQARSGVDAVMADVEEQKNAAFDAVQDSLATIEEKLEDAVQQRPIAAIGLALGLGVLIGVTWRR